MSIFIISVSYGPAFDHLKSNKNPERMLLWNTEDFK